MSLVPFNHLAWFRSALSIIFVVGYFATLWLVFTRELPAGNKDAANLVIGVLTTAVVLIVNYYFRNMTEKTGE